MGSPRVAPEVRTKVEAAIREPAGRSRAAIAREFGVSTRTVQRYADDLGLADSLKQVTADTRAATEAAREHLRARRAALSARMLDEAEYALDQLHVPFLAFSFGGKDNTYNEHQLPGPPAGDIRNLMTSAAVAIDKHVVLDRHDAQAEDDQAGEVLGKLFDGLGAAYRAIKASKDVDDEPEATT